MFFGLYKGLHTRSHMCVIFVVWIELPQGRPSLSQPSVFFYPSSIQMYSGKFIVKWARHFLSFSPSVNAEVNPQTGGYVRNSTDGDGFSTSWKNISIKCCVVGFLSTPVLISHTQSWYLRQILLSRLWYKLGGTQRSY